MLKQPKILIVDDVPANVDILVSMLKDKTYQLSVAMNGQQAIQRVQKVVPDLILLDVRMPGLDGFETCVRIKQLPESREIPIIFVTGQTDDLAKGFEVGGSDYINKPVIASELYARIDSQLKIRFLVSQLAQSNAELEQRVRKRTLELTVANRNLRSEINERRLVEERLTFLARHDFLTRILNRESFESILDEHILKCEEEDGFFVLYMDLDQFKLVNEICSHVAGDELLRQTTSLIKGLIRDNDVFARLGSDSFALLLKRNNLGDAQGLAKNIQDTISEFRFEWQDQVFKLGMTIIVYPLNQYIIDSNQVISISKAACTQAKTKKPNQIITYGESEEDIKEHRSQLMWANRLKNALENSHFKLAHQPMEALNKGDPAYPMMTEILVRLADSDTGRLETPETFLHTAERFLLMPDLDRWVITKCLHWLKNHPEFLDHYAIVSINLSGQTLNFAGMADYILKKIGESGINPGSICFEITETAAIADISRTKKFIEKIREIGCHFALDDFGSGFSSYSYLRMLPVDILKIDGSFVVDIVRDKVSRDMVHSINELAQKMGKKTVAEYVESEIGLEQLSSIGVDYVQGYHLARPAVLEEEVQPAADAPTPSKL